MVVCGGPTLVGMCPDYDLAARRRRPVYCELIRLIRVTFAWAWPVHVCTPAYLNKETNHAYILSLLEPFAAPWLSGWIHWCHSSSRSCWIVG